MQMNGELAKLLFDTKVGRLQCFPLPPPTYLPIICHWFLSPPLLRVLQPHLFCFFPLIHPRFHSCISLCLFSLRRFCFEHTSLISSAESLSNNINKTSFSKYQVLCLKIQSRRHSKNERWKRNRVQKKRNRPAAKKLKGRRIRREGKSGKSELFLISEKTRIKRLH